MFTHFTAKQNEVCARFMFRTNTATRHPHPKLAIEEGNIAWRQNILFNWITNEGCLSFNIISARSLEPGAFRLACQRLTAEAIQGRRGMVEKNRELQEAVG